MANKQYAYINHEMLKWAREETPLELNSICTRIKDITEEEIIKWESGEEFPSITNAKKLANLYDIPFAALYLTEVPPSSKIEYVDRRSLSTSHLEGISYELWKEIRYFKSCRESMLSMIDNEYDAASIPRFEKNDDFEKMIEKIREYFEIETPLKNKTAFGNNVFSYFRRKIERKGILVFQISGMEVSQIRGISLNYEIFPIIAVNKKDSERAKVFTMFHELAHLIRRTSALCSVDLSETNDSEEKKCDKIAGNILVPKDKIESLKSDNIDNDKIENLANRFGVSTFVILKRLYDMGKISNSFYKSKYEELYSNFMENKENIEKRKKNSEVRIPHHTKFLSTNGNLFPSIVINAYYEGRISLGEVCKTLNLKTKHIDMIERVVML